MRVTFNTLSTKLENTEEHITIKIPRVLKEKFDGVNSRLNLGYTGIADFTREALREKFERLGVN